MDDVEEVAVSGAFIVGRSRTGFFIFDTRSDAFDSSTPVVCAAAPEWRKGLRDVGVPPDVQLHSPDAIAATFPDAVVRPWNYVTMQGLLGWSDGIWSFALQLLGFFCVFLIGLLRPNRSVGWPSLLIGWFFIDGLAYMIVGGGGTGVIPGLVLFPLVCGLAGATGQGVRNVARRLIPGERPAKPNLSLYAAEVS